MKVEDFQRLKTKVETLQRKKDRAQGALDQKSEEMKKEMGTDNVDEANKKLAKLEEETGEVQKAFEDEMELFQEKWGEKLEEV